MAPPRPARAQGGGQTAHRGWWAKGKSDTLTVGETESAVKRDRLEIILNFSDELRRIAPGQKR
jgi:hypothetical protein